MQYSGPAQTNKQTNLHLASLCLPPSLKDLCQLSLEHVSQSTKRKDAYKCFLFPRLGPLKHYLRFEKNDFFIEMPLFVCLFVTEVPHKCVSTGSKREAMSIPFKCVIHAKMEKRGRNLYSFSYLNLPRNCA